MAEIVIGGIRHISDKDAANEIIAIIVDVNGNISIAEIAERTRLPFDQIEQLVDFKRSW